jgi:hypothetical protein
MDTPPTELSGVLERVVAGDKIAADRLWPLVYENTTQGDSLIYSNSGDSITHVEGMLTGFRNQTTPRLRTWNRKRR